jgi:hypothetical protein
MLVGPLTPGTQYHFGIRSVDGLGGISAESNQVAQAPPEDGPAAGSGFLAQHTALGGVGNSAAYPLVARVEPTMDLDLSANNLGALGIRWSGLINPPLTGSYTFWLSTPGEGYVYVDDVQTGTVLSGGNSGSGTVMLTAGQKVDVHAETRLTALTGRVRLEWQPPGGTRTVVPQDAVFPGVPLP